MTITVYGIKNCDTVKRARKWLETHSVDYRFHDFRQDGLSQSMLSEWTQELGWETVLNRRGTTWRQLPESERESIDEVSAVRLMMERPSLIKRPVLDQGGRRLIGFDETAYRQQLLK